MNVAGREKKVLYTGGVCLGLIVFYLFAVKPVYQKHLNVKANIEKKGILLSRYKTILKRENHIKKRVAFIKKEFGQLDKVLLTGSKPSLAASELQSILENIIKNARVSITNLKNKKPEERDAFYQIPIEITVECTLRELRDIIYHIENSNKFLFVRDLDVRLVKSGNPEILKSKLIVNGFSKNSSYS